MIGQFVNADGGKQFSLWSSSFHHGFGRDSKAVTLQNGKRNLQQLASGLSLNSSHVDAAHNYFKVIRSEPLISKHRQLAVEHKFIQGRKTENVVAACLYIECRKQQTPHMLLDFSDHLHVRSTRCSHMPVNLIRRLIVQINVFVLGAVYLKLCRKLRVKLPIVDPSLYIVRFSHKFARPPPPSTHTQTHTHTHTHTHNPVRCSRWKSITLGGESLLLYVLSQPSPRTTCTSSWQTGVQRQDARGQHDGSPSGVAHEAGLDPGASCPMMACSILTLARATSACWLLPVAMARLTRGQVGRRPAGICGAALLIAARLHGFSRTQTEVCKLRRVCRYPSLASTSPISTIHNTALPDYGVRFMLRHRSSTLSGCATRR